MRFEPTPRPNGGVRDVSLSDPATDIVDLRPD